MDHLIIIYPNGHTYIDNIYSVLEKNGKVVDHRTYHITGHEAYGFILQLYWNPSHIDNQSLMNKIKKSGWKTMDTTGKLTAIIWKSKSKNISSEMMGKSSKFKCYLRRIASVRENIDYNFYVYNERECKLEKSTLHSPDNTNDLIRLIPVFFHESTFSWILSVSWPKIIHELSSWLHDYYDILENLYSTHQKIWYSYRWSSTGKIIPEQTNKMHQDGVYWCGIWMPIPPVTVYQWKEWMQESEHHIQSGGSQKLWSHPATMKKRDIQLKKYSDYVLSWKADGVHGVLKIGQTKWEILNEVGAVVHKGTLYPENYGLSGYSFEGEYLESQKEFLAFDVMTDSDNGYPERTKVAHSIWKDKQKNMVLWDGLKISSTLTVYWKPSLSGDINLDEYLKEIDDSGYGYDGLIFTPLETSWRNFGTSPDNMIMKWKPLSEQTIDVYVFNGKIWLKDFQKKVNPFFLRDFTCGKNIFERGHYPREWTRSLLSKEKPSIQWDDGSKLEDHNDEIWEIRWGKTENKSLPSNIWKAVRRRSSNKEILLKNVGKNGVCGGKFVGPNAMRTMIDVERILHGDGVSLSELKEWFASSGFRFK